MNQKKVYMIFIFVLMLFPMMILAKDTCNSNDIKIKSIDLKESNGFSEEVEEANINNNIINLNLEMYNVGESITYKIKVKNNSNNDYYFTKDSFNLNTDHIEYEILNNSAVIKPNEEKEIELKITYKNKTPEDEFNENNRMSITLSDTPLSNPSTKRSLVLILLIVGTTTILAFVGEKKLIEKFMIVIFVILTVPLVTHASCTINLEINANITINEKEAIFLPGKEVNIKVKELAGDDTSTSTNPYTFQDENITAIKYSNTEPVDSEKQEKNIVSTIDSPYPIYMWYEEGVIYWWSEVKHPKLNEDSSWMFGNMYGLSDINGFKEFDTTNMTNISSMFTSNCSLVNIEALSKWNTSNVTSMNSTFHDCRQLESIEGIQNWDTSNVEYMIGLFNTDINLSDFTPIKNWNVKSVKNMHSIFSCCFSVEEIDLSNWETSSLEDMSYMFAQLWINIDGQLTTGGVLKRIILSEKFDTSKVTSMNETFYNNRVIENYGFLKYLDTSNVVEMRAMFYNNSNFNHTRYLKDWNVSNVENMDSLFIGIDSLTDLTGLKNWNTQHATDMTYMFRNCTSLASLSGLENWDVSSVTTFNYMFDGAQNLANASSINNWNISSDATFTKMFGGVQTHPEFSKAPGTWSNGTFTPTP